ncbi:MAG: DNA translocase FtsK [Saprospiraceae bacterium]|nr:DNA translocase FtsK [Saprospiraceae bacterium]
MGFLLLFFAVYLAIAFTSYLFTWQTDQDQVLRFSWDLLFNGDAEMANWLGRLGAIVSNMFFYWGFGLPSFLLVFLFFVYGRALITRTPLSDYADLLRNTAVLIVFLSIFLEFLFGRTGFPWGGAFGEAVCAWLYNFVGLAGMIVLFLLMAAVVVVWFFNPNFEELTPTQAVDNTKGFFGDMLRGDFSTVKQNNHRLKVPQVAPVKKGKIVAVSDEDLDELLAAPTSVADKVKSDGLLEFDGAVISNKANKPIISKDTELEIATPVNEVLATDYEPPKRISDDPNHPIAIDKEYADESVLHESLASNSEPYDPTLELSSYEYPVLALLDDYGDQKAEMDREELEANKDQIIATLLHYKIEITKIKATIGPTVTLYEIIPAPGVRISKIKNLEDDIALSLAALGIRIIAPIPGKGTIGIEVPNKNKNVVSLKEVLMSDKFKRSNMDIPIALGKTISNEVFVADLAKMPHLLIAGATGQGKSVGINTILMSMLYRKHPSQVKLVLVDPKKVELFPYSKLESHFLGFLPSQVEPIVTDTTKVIHTLNSLCMEMDDRYNLLKKANARNIKEYNEKFTARRLNPEKGHHFMPFIVLVIDEFADLIMTAGKEIELPIGRLAQLSRAVGIHLVIATQRPSVNIITGIIKANFPARLAFKVTSKVDSRTILDTSGAEQLIGRGDMLLSIGSEAVRLQSAFVDTPEVERVIDYIHQQRGYPTPYYLPDYQGGEGEQFGQANGVRPEELDDMMEDAAKLVIQTQHGSTSMIQRRLKLGYNRAGRIMDQMEALGIVGPSEGSKPREVLIYDELELERYLKDIKIRK